MFPYFPFSMMKEKIITVLLVLIVTSTCVSSKKNRKNKQHVPYIDCDIKAGKIVNPEFLAKCPAGCQDGKHRVYGTDIYASFSSICTAAIHSGVIDNSGGKIFVRKVAGQSGYKGSFSNGIRSLSLPRWKESFVIAGQAVPAVPGRAPNQVVRSPTMYSSSRQIQRSNPGASRIQQILAEKAIQANPSLQRRDWQSPSRVNVPVVQRRPVVPERSNVAPNTGQSWSSDTRDSQVSPRRDWQSPSRVNIPVVQRRPQAPESSNVAPPANPNWSVDTYDYEVSQRRDSLSQNQRLNVPPVRRPAVPESSNVAPPAAPSWPVETRDTQVSNPKTSMSEFDRWVSGFSQSNSRNSESETTWKVPEEIPETRVQVKPEVRVEAVPDPWRGFSESGGPVKEEVHSRVPVETGAFGGTRGPVKEELNARVPVETVALGGTNCKIDLVFLMDGSWSIGKRRFRLQKLFLNQMADALDVGISGPLMGIVQYGDEPYTEFSLRSYFNSKDLKNAIDKIPQKGGHSNVGKALSYINRSYFSDASGNRGAAPNVAIVLVDGWPTDKVEEASRLARESGINIFFVTIEAADDNERSNVVEPNFVDKAVCRTNGHFSVSVPSWFGLPKIVNPLVKRMCDIDKLVCSKTCLNAADIGFVIDGSSSVGTGNFRTVLQFIANITSEFEISDTDTRIGAVQYTYEQRLEFGFDKYSTKQDVVNAIMRIGYWSGGTSTGAAITYAYDQLFSKSKPNKRKIMIVITDGRSYDDVRAPAAAAHRNGVIAYAVGIAWAAQDELESIATDPDKEHSFFVDEFDSLYKFVGKIIQNICTEYNSQPRN
ncbi:vitrin isoform X5 [Hyla sarda]|uniref:vitrin isoform X5 n=1 Tax=Hyla sarda TaxID=327740 RepID=UPI0024C34E9C|nr:vitrin isoform X5 [Hyla sarda]